MLTFGFCRTSILGMAAFDTFTKSEFIATVVVGGLVANGAFQFADFERRVEAMGSRPPEQVWEVVTEQSPNSRSEWWQKVIARVAAAGRSARVFGGVNVEGEFDLVRLPGRFDRAGGLALSMEMTSQDQPWSDWQDDVLRNYYFLCRQSNCLSDDPGTLFQDGDLAFLQEGSVAQSNVVQIECTAPDRSAQTGPGSRPTCMPAAS